MEKGDKKNREKKNRKAYIPLAVILTIVVTAGIFWYSRYLRYIKTDDALIDGDDVTLAPKMMGRITAIYTDEGDTVHAGQLLVQLDSTDILAQIRSAWAKIDEVKANLNQIRINHEAEKINLSVFEISADKAKTDFDRASQQKQSGVITEEKFETVQKAYQTASAQLQTARTHLKVSEAQIRTAEATLKSAEAQLNIQTTSLQNTKLYSPFNGIVANKWSLPGDIVQPGQTILTINSSGEKWVSVYIEETKLHSVHLGQNAKFVLDALPDVEFFGKVIYIGNNTASLYSLIPPSNASGNFTKITQRVQIKVSVESARPGALRDYNLIQGMSVVMRLIK